MKRPVILALVGAVIAICFALVAATAGGYWYYLRTPTYSIKQIGRAVETHDLELFKRHVDMDSVANGMMEAFLASTQAEQGASMSGGMLLLMKPRFVEEVRGQITTFVEKGTKLRSFYAPPDVEQVEHDGKMATARLRCAALPSGPPLLLTLRMRDKGGYWQVSELVNAEDVMKQTQRARAQ